MDFVTAMKNKVFSGGEVSAEEAFRLYSAPKDSLREAADEIRAYFLRDAFDFCCIVNGKSGKCTENCKFCAQSAFYHAPCEEYPLLEPSVLVRAAKRADECGIPRFSIVTSGRRLTEEEVDAACVAVREIKRETKVSVCISFGLLDKEQFLKLKQAGVTRVHNNLETSASFFKNVCTTHRYSDKIAAIRAAQEVGLEVCSGGIFGMGETLRDRVDMAIELRSLGIRSVPINILNPIPGTPLAEAPKLKEEELLKTIAVFRFLLPRAFLRLAGGRGKLSDMGRECFRYGANAAITGDMLTTSGVSVKDDCDLIRELNFAVQKDAQQK